MQPSNFSMTIFKISIISIFVPLSIGVLFVVLLFLDGLASWHLNKCSSFLICSLDSIGQIWDGYFFKIFLLLWIVSFGLLMWSGKDIWRDKFNSR